MVFWDDGVEAVRGLMRVKETANCTPHDIFHSNGRGIVLCLVDAVQNVTETEVALALQLHLVRGNVFNNKVSDEWECRQEFRCPRAKDTA
eukprot:3208000-Pyramimonas_sp.AAC.2